MLLGYTSILFNIAFSFLTLCKIKIIIRKNSVVKIIKWDITIDVLIDYRPYFSSIVTISFYKWLPSLDKLILYSYAKLHHIKKYNIFTDHYQNEKT
jgi:hypothetical protein